MTGSTLCAILFRTRKVDDVFGVVCKTKAGSFGAGKPRYRKVNVTSSKAGSRNLRSGGRFIILLMAFIYRPALSIIRVWGNTRMR